MDTRRKLKYVRTMTLLICAVALGTLIGCGSRNARSSNIKKAEEHMAAGMYQRAIPLLQQEINENPESPKAHFLQGKCKLAVGAPEEAERCFERAKRLDPDLSKEVDRALVRCEVTKENIQTAKAKTRAARTNISGIGINLNLFEQDNGSYPTTQEGLIALPLYRKEGVPKDAWGNPYVYRYPGQHNVHDYDLYSFGPDGKEGGGDDIDNWTNSLR
jgi:general secretion pathway protein G